MGQDVDLHLWLEGERKIGRKETCSSFIVNKFLQVRSKLGPTL